MNIRAFLISLLREEKAATAVEYGLIVAMIVIAMIISLEGVASATIDMWNNVATRVTTA